MSFSPNSLEKALLFNGKIPSCSSFGCGWQCCQFNVRPGYYVILQPNELEIAVEKGFAVDHLRIVDRDFHGGMRAYCTAKNRICCDVKWKPWDCRMYPLYPAIDERGQLVSLTYDTSCLLTAYMDTALAQHKAYVAQLLMTQIKARPELEAFYKKDDLGDFAKPILFPEFTRLLAANHM